MLTSLEIENFKCFRQLKIEPLAKVNLFVGTSNSGKTAVLEAVSLLPGSGGGLLEGNLDPGVFREGPTQQTGTKEYAKWLFNGEGSIKITARLISGKEPSSVTTTHVRQTPFKILPMPSVQELRFSNVSTHRLSSSDLARNYDHWTLRAANEDRLALFMKVVDPRLKSLRAMEHTGDRKLYADLGLPERIPLTLLGEGFNRLVQIFGAIIGESANIVLIDEIENGLHWSALPQIWTGIREAVNKEEVQIFATTHSLECISAAAEAFKGEPKNDLAVHRLDRLETGDIRCVTMNEDELQRMLDRDWEVR